ncbi:GspH/FimT family pseudopilin [Pelomonas sp. BJYL3]|uniref:GspH/FimT family pseudopilin n=1 Tax=Pelomonas sp. BJYL3 TaxID=2976697 RepID=UPI0022B4E8EB|nr:GspH/FimT family pseudopilin [Pelomonas sp. BJYL3]
MRASRQRGFTMIEILVVMLIVAIASVSVTLALRDSSQTQVEREAERLAALLESARAEARVAGLPVRWRPVEDASGSGFRFEGLPERIQLPRQWLGEDMHAEIEGAQSLLLGPEPLIPAQALRLRHGNYSVRISSDGLSAFAVQPATQEP